MYFILMIDDTVENIAKSGLYVGIVFAIFAALLLYNFITISILHNQREIGILRAIGVRSLDVMKIFISESLIIAFFCGISIMTTMVATRLLNQSFRESYGILLTMFRFGIR